MTRLLTAGLLAWLCSAAVVSAAPPIEYRLSFPAPEHHWMQVDVRVSELGTDPIELRMSRTSPGRYALHEFAKNVYDVRAFDAAGQETPIAQPDPHGWRVERHGGVVHVQYKVFGDRVDGTYLAVDPTHAHINMPAALMFARGFDDRGATVTFVPPAGRDSWQVATQLLPGRHALEFTAPNLQYLMDSPAEFGPIAIQTFVLDGHTFRFAAHHDGTPSDLEGFVRDVREIVDEQRAIFGEYPAYDPGFYTFLADYLPYANSDGMEHRNSTVISAAASIRNDRERLLATAAHEFFHNWNVERIRPRSLEPFNFDGPNMSGELWLAEGFTQYYGPLTLSRTGLADLSSTSATLAGIVASVALSPARHVRSADAMSRMAVFTDGGRPIDPTNWATTYISYYPFGAAIALALDLTLRDRFDGRLTLDDFMRAMWKTYGKPGGSRMGYVDHPYTLADAQQCLADLTASPAFAQDFFARYVVGHDVADYAQLLERAGLLLRRRTPDQAWLGDVRIGRGLRGLRLEGPTVPGSPIHDAGLDRGDEIIDVDGRKVDDERGLAALIATHRPGDRLRLTIADRAGTTRVATVVLGSDPALDLTPAEATGRPLTDAQRTFRRRWLGSQR